VNWAHFAILELKAGQQAKMTPHGSSMKGKVESGDEVVLAPVFDKMCASCEGGRLREDVPCTTCGAFGWMPDLSIDDVVLVKVKGSVYLHLIKATRTLGNSIRYQIGNNRAGINGWVPLSAIYGVAIKVAGRTVKTIPEKVK
jgi:hypothetical protein